MSSDFRRVNLYRVEFGYVLGNHAGLKESVIYAAHEQPESVLRWLAAQRDYPGCEIRKLELMQNNVLVPL